LERHIGRHAGCLAAASILGPCLRQEDLHRDTAAARLAGEVQADGDLAVVDPAERSRVLPRDRDGMRPLLGKARVIDDERLDPRQLGLELARQPAAHLVVRPVGDDYGLLKPLSHRLDLGRVVHQPRRHRLDALALTVEQQARDVGGERLATFRPPHALDHRSDELAELSVELPQIAPVHPDRRSHAGIPVKQVTR
jgi:hypothetical protein